MSLYQIIPNPGDIPAQSQQDLFNNFNELNTQIGTEHTALNAAANLGKHKYTTMVRNPTDPLPVGDDIIIRQGFVGGKWSLETRDKNNVFRHIPLRSVHTFALPAGGNTTPTVDFSTLGFGAGPDFTSGTIHVYPVTGVHKNQQMFTMFTWDGATLFVPNNKDSQLYYNGVGAVWKGMDSGGTVLRLTTSGGWAADTVHVIITESRG